MPRLTRHLEIERCPHCGVSCPNLQEGHAFKTDSQTGDGERYWKIYVCFRCGGVVTACSDASNGEARALYPSPQTVSPEIPDPARTYLSQAYDSLAAPAGSIMLSASSIDAMLKNRGLESGTLFERIDKASEQHLITDDMALWAHSVRLDANAQRHADKDAGLPSDQDAQRAFEFAMALAQFLFVLPSRVKRGLAAASEKGAK